jgi:hypothetical protein
VSSRIGSVIDGQLITRLSQIAGVRSARSGGSSDVTFSGSEQVRVTLNSGGRAFAKAFTDLNRAANFVSLGIDTLKQLDGIVTKVINIAERASRPGSGTGDRGNMSAEFRRLGGQFSKILEAVDQTGDFNPLSETDIENVLINVGLDKERSIELASIFKKLKMVAGSSSLAEDNVRDPRPVPPITDDESSSANSQRYNQVFETGRVIRTRDDGRILAADAKVLQGNIRKNIATLEDVTQNVIDNMELVRATAIAMLDGSRDQRLLALRDSSSVAEAIRNQVLAQGKPAATRQAGNLDSILAVSLIGN